MKIEKHFPAPPSGAQKSNILSDKKKKYLETVLFEKGTENDFNTTNNQQQPSKP